MEIISRKDAQKKGYRRYYTGISCIHGHNYPRDVKTTVCVMCNRLNTKKHRERRHDPNGKIRIVVFIHPDDAQLIRDTVAALNEARQEASVSCRNRSGMGTCSLRPDGALCVKTFSIDEHCPDRTH